MANFSGGSENTDARQILITEVAKGSPADCVIANGDMVTGLNGQAFGGDARRLFAQAVTEAENEANGGVLKLIRWRASAPRARQSRPNRGTAKLGIRTSWPLKS